MSHGCDQLLILDQSSNEVKAELELDEYGALHRFGDGS